MKIRGVLFAIAAAGMVPVAAMAQWSDNFDSYSPGTINGQGGWQGWDGNPAFAGTVTSALALSAPNSQQINSASDSVHLYSGVSTGMWTYTAKQYIPSSFTGSTYFILLNTYNDGGPYDWSVELQFLGGTGQIVDDLRASNPVTFVRDAWAEIRIDFDLTANTISQFYNGSLIASGTWTTGTPSVLNLAAVDLFGGTGTDVYYDDMRLIPAPASAALMGLAGLLSARRRRN
ncbi:MAG: hypothetical protein IT436_16975 [Phycisphaerales bacterium]|nr:hypothetical protein [Phycisphaerales bacterium]